MSEVKYSDRTVRGGIWYEIMCQNCLYRKYVFEPRRGKVE